MEIEFNMGPILLTAGSIRFSKTARSKTARSRPGHGEAGGNRLDLREPAILGRRFADDVVERPAERSQAGEADVETNLGDGTAGFAEQKHGALDPATLEVTVRRFAERGTEGADEVGLRDACDTGEAGNVQRLSVGAIHCVARAELPAVELLDGTAPRRNEATRQQAHGGPICFRTFIPVSLTAAPRPAKSCLPAPLPPVTRRGRVFTTRRPTWG